VLAAHVDHRIVDVDPAGADTPFREQRQELAAAAADIQHVARSGEEIDVAGESGAYRFRRAAMPKIDCEPDHEGDRKELALPVLERFEPELTRRQVRGQGKAGLAMHHPIVACFSPTPERVAHPGANEQQRKRQPE
jgi:hypothetical protein